MIIISSFCLLDDLADDEGCGKVVSYRIRLENRPHITPANNNYYRSSNTLFLLVVVMDYSSDENGWFVFREIMIRTSG